MKSVLNLFGCVCVICLVGFSDVFSGFIFWNKVLFVVFVNKIKKYVFKK